MAVVHIHILYPAAEGLDRTTVRRSAEVALELAAVYRECELTVKITGDEEVRRLNREYGNQDRVTDVLSFPEGTTNPENGALYLGDILISFPQAQAQIQGSDRLPVDEIQLLIVHGILHLIGYDHHEADERDRMWALQSKILKRIGIPHDITEWV